MIKNLKLVNFRNYTKRDFEFSDKTTVVVGANASGKTNILEALFLLSTGKSFKARKEGEMIKYSQDVAHVSGVLSLASPKSTLKLDATITTGQNGWPKKKLLVNGVSRRIIDFAGNFKTVLFGPWDMDLVTESPTVRRKFLDTVLSQADREYRRSILSYEKGLRQRNRLLWRIREEGVPRSQLLFWNQLLIKNGDYITQKREEFISFVNKDNESSSSVNTNNYKLEYDRSVISEGRLEQYASEEIASATTLVGPHRDDFVFMKGGEPQLARNLSAFGSRGEQRMGVLWLKMAELSFIEEKTGEKPTLLLDDIFSELDHEHRKIVMELADNQQTIITTADEHFLEGLGNNEDRIALK